MSPAHGGLRRALGQRTGRPSGAFRPPSFIATHIHTYSPRCCVLREQVCRAVGSLSECADNKAHLDEQQVCRTLTLTLARHVAGGGSGDGAAGSGGMFANVFAAQSRHSAAVAQWGTAALTSWHPTAWLTSPSCCCVLFLCDVLRFRRGQAARRCICL